MGVECLTSKEIGRLLGTSFRTVESQRYQVLAKTGCRNVQMLARRLALDEIH
jgi:DNA-binding CsgD family transcriptional regulator